MKKFIFIFTLLCNIANQNSYITTIFAHGIVDGPLQISRFSNVIATPSQHAVAFSDSQNCTGYNFNALLAWAARATSGKNFNRANMCMGQTDDIATLRNAFATDCNDGIIGYGCSRGAAALINFVAQCNPQNLKALVLDATPATMAQTIEEIVANCGINTSYSESIFKYLFPKYQNISFDPINTLHTIKNKNLPILLLHSKTDARVNVIHAFKLFQAFKNAGFLNVHLIILPAGRHSFILQDSDEKIVTMYQQAVHHFYKKYDLDYNQNLIDPTFDLDAHKPTDTEMISAIQKYDTIIAQTYRNALIRNYTILLLAIAIACKKDLIKK